MKKRILSMLLALATMLSMLPLPASAASTLEEAMAEVDIYGNTEPLTWLTMNGSVKTQFYTYYVYRSALTGQTTEIPAYCVDPNLYGVPLKAPDASTPIKYSASETVSDPKVCGIIANGYPHIDMSTLGVQSVQEAYYATKTALWCYILSTWDISKLGINPNLSGADKAAAERVLQAAKDIYTRGMHWNKLVEPKLTAVPDKPTAYAATINGESVYQQVFTVTSETWSVEPVLLALAEGAPSGSKILDMNNNQINSLSITDATAGDNGYSWTVKVVFPATSVEGQTGSATLTMRSTVVQYAIYFAKTLERDKYGNIQEYMLDTDPHIPITGSAVSNYSSDTPDTPDTPETPQGTGLLINKLETGTNNPLSGAIFEIKYPDGSSLGSCSTNASGQIYIPLTITGNYTITELVSAQNHILPEVRTQNVTVTHGKVAEVTFHNAPVGHLRIEKRSDTGEALKGVTIQAKHIADGTTLSGQTNSAGVIEFQNVQTGGWEIREIAGIEGWQFDGDTVKTVAVTTGETSTVTFVNQELPGLRIVKYDRTSLQTMADVTFEIFKDGTSIGRYTTDAMGEIVLTNAAPGTYLVKEVQSVDSHITDTTPQEIELKAGDGIRQLVFYNDKKPGIHLVKVDSANLSKPIANACFSIKAVDGSYGPEEFTTGADGTIDLSRLPTGAYVVTELSCPGYVIDEAQRIIQLDGNETAEFVFTNSIRPSIHIVKISSDGSPLPGVAFRIAKIEDGTSYLDRTTDQNGEILINDLDPGVYSVRETSTVADHVLDLREFHVELFAGRTSTLVVENQKRPNLTVYKHDADTGEAIADTVFQVKAADGHSVDEIKTDANGKAELYNLLPGVYEISEKSVPADWLMDAPAQLVTLYANRDHTVYFENHRKPTLTVNKVSSVTGKALEGAKFNVTYGSNDTNTGEINDLGTYYTDENGQFTLTRLTDGWYKVTELASVDGYQPANVKTNVQTLYIGGGDNAVMTFENVPLSAITVYKYDNVTGEAVRDAVFEVRYLTDTSGTGGTAIGRYKTGVNGSFTVTGLIKGTYVVEELASDSGHVIDTAPQTVFLSGEDQNVVQLYFGNTPKGSVLITKKDAVTLAPLSGVEFTVSDSNGALLGSANGKFITDSAGTILIENLEPSVTVVAKETRTISGYILDNTPQTVKVQPGKTVTLEFLDQPKGNLVIRKFDSVTKQPLPGAEFKVTMANGELTPDNEGLTSSNGLYLTDENGQITLSKLTPATYVISETKAPDGYALDNQTQTVVVGAADTQTVSFYNEPLATLMLLKRDAVSKLPLANAEFTVKTADGTAIGTNNGLFTTDDTGTATVTGIQPNTAVVVSEDSAPAGYVANSTPKTIVVKSGVPNRLTFDNEPTTTLLIHKYIEGTNNEPLSGVGFRVTDSTGAAVGPNNGTYYTDRAGEIMLTGLAPGITVTAQEFKTVDGYVLDGTPQSVLIKDYQKMELTFWNAKAQTLTINKYVAGTTDPIQGVRFQVTSSDGSAIGTNNGEFLTDRNGQIKIDGLTPGVTITAREIENVSGFVLDSAPQSILIKAGEAQTLNFYNQAKGTLIVEKRDSISNAVLADAEFRINTIDGAYVDDNEGATSTQGIYKTDAHGQIVLRNLQPNTYVITETKAPEGYVLDSETKTVKVNADDAQTIVFTNTPKQTVVIQKYAEGTTTPLEGVRFFVTDANGNPITGNGMFVTDANGRITITGLEPGTTLVARETRTVKGYALNSTPQTIQVTANSSMLHSSGTPATTVSSPNQLTFYEELCCKGWWLSLPNTT